MNDMTRIFPAYTETGGTITGRFPRLRSQAEIDAEQERDNRGPQAVVLMFAIIVCGWLGVAFWGFW